MIELNRPIYLWMTKPNASDQVHDSGKHFRFARKGAARYIGTSVCSLDYLVANGQLKTLRESRKVMFLRTELEVAGASSAYWRARCRRTWRRCAIDGR